MAGARSPDPLEQAIDHLYQLPPGEFTAARNALAKAQTGDARQRVHTLTKPTAVPWAVNQLYWHDRAEFDRLMKAGAALRKAQVDVLEGRKHDLRAATAAQREATSAAVARAAELGAAHGVHPGEEPLRRMLEAISTAAALPAPLGRFTEAIGPSGFEAMAGVVPTGRRLAEASPHHRRTGTKGAAAQRENESDRRRREHEAAIEAARRGLTEAEAAGARAEMRLKAAREQLAVREAEIREARANVKKARAALARAGRS